MDSTRTLLALLAACTLAAHAAPGDLDPSFGTGGKVTTPIGSSNDGALNVAVQVDGKIVVAGYSSNGSSNDIALVRYTDTGALDPAFGTGGKVTTSIGSVDSAGYSIAVQGDGKIVVAGFTHNGSNYDIALVRYMATGALDPAFGTGGKVTTSIGSSDDGARGVAIQSDGKIVVTGYTRNGSNFDFALLRYTATGALDPAFGTGGKVTTPIGSGDEIGYKVAVQGDGKIVVVGYSHNGSNNDIALVRYTDTGALDPTFGTGGKVTTPIGSGDEIGVSMAVQGDGKIVVAGYSHNGSNFDIALVRYTDTGALDPTFGTGGKVTTPIGSSDEIGHSVAVQGDGKIVVAGYSFNGSNFDIALVRYTATGALDPAFGTGGKATTPIGNGQDFGYSVAVQGDGKIVVAGTSRNGSTDDFAVVRYLGAPPDLTPPGVVASIGSDNPSSSTVAQLGNIVSLTVVTTEPTHPPVVTLLGQPATVTGGPTNWTATRLVDAVTPEGPATFSITATDLAGNAIAAPVTTTSDGSSVLVDRTAPGLTATIASNNGVSSTVARVNDTVALTVVTTEPTQPPGVTLLGQPATVTGGPTNWTATRLVDATTPEGLATFSITATDLVGNPLPAPVTTTGDGSSVTVDRTGPAGGSFAVTPPSPVAAGTTLTGAFAGWVDVSTPLLYSISAGAEGTIVPPGTDATPQFTLPPGTYPVTGRVTDALGNFTEVTVTVEVSAPPADPVHTVLYGKGDAVPGAGVVGSGIPAGAVWTKFGVPALNAQDDAAFVAEWVSPTGKAKVVARDNHLQGAVDVIMAKGAPVPGAGTGGLPADAILYALKDPILAPDGDVLTPVVLRGTGITSVNDAALIWSPRSNVVPGFVANGGVALETPSVVIREGDAIPGTGGARVLGIKGVQIGSAGVAFTATLVKGTGTPAVTSADDFVACVWDDTDIVTVVAREGQTLGAKTLKSFKTLAAGNTAPGHGRGAADLESTLKALGLLAKFSDGSSAILSVDETGAVTAAVGTGATGPGLPDGGTFKALGLPAWAQSFAAPAFVGTLGTGVKGIFQLDDDTGESTPVIVVGDELEPGLNVAGLKDPVVSSDGFRKGWDGTIKGAGVTSTNDRVITTGYASGWSIVAREGGALAEPSGGALWKSFKSLAMPVNGPLLLGQLAQGVGGITSANDVGVWGTDSGGDLRSLFREGDTIGGKVLKTFVCLKAVSGSPGATRAWNDGGCVVWRASFADGTSAIVHTLVP